MPETNLCLSIEENNDEHIRELVSLNINVINFLNLKSYSDIIRNANKVLYAYGFSDILNYDISEEIFTVPK